MVNGKILILFILFFLSGCSLIVEETNDTYSNITVTRIIDGDTFVINTGEKVRLLCINTPEKGKEYYKEATDYLSNLTLGKNIIMKVDKSNVDRYGRLLRYIYLENGTFVNYEIVRNGYGLAQRYKPDIAKCPQLEDGMALAKQERLNIWS